MPTKLRYRQPNPKITPGVKAYHTPGVILTISIVSFNTRALLQRCLASIYQFTRGIKFEVVVVDNHSTDGSALMVKKSFPKVKLIANTDNQFYTGANNQTLRQAQGKYLLILNSDIFLKDDALTKMVRYLERHPRVGAIECLQLYEDGRMVSTASKHNSPFLDFLELTWLGRILKPFFKSQLERFRMVDKDRRQTFKAEVICDAVMMIKTDLLRSFGGYDEKFKLYYTENDLCKKVQKKKLQTVHFAAATVWHRVSASTDKAGWKTISQIYTADAYVYYRKYHSFFSAIGLNLMMQLNNLLISLKQNWQIAAILLLSIFLRFYRLADIMTFIGDQGRDYLAARDWLLGGQIPLVGIPSSVPWLHQGPFFIHLTALALKIGQFNPVAPAVLTATLGVLAVYFTYRVGGKLAALIMATSPLAVIHSRMAYHTSPIPLLAVLYIWAMKEKRLGWSLFLAALLLQFELTTLPLLILAIVWFWPKRKQLIRWSPVVLLPFIPKIIYDFSHGFIQTLGFGAWASYRTATLWRSFGQIGSVSQTVFGYWQKFIAFDQPLVAAVLGLALIALIWRQKLLLWFLVINLFAFYVHGGPSEAYFPVLFPVFALALGKLKGKWRLALVVLAIYNSWFLFGHNFVTYGQTLSQRLQAVYLIKHLAPTNVGVNLVNHPSNEFASYLDNYRYLLWWRGIKLDEAGRKIMIYDGPDDKFVAPAATTVYHLSGQKVIVYD